MTDLYSHQELTPDPLEDLAAEQNSPETVREPNGAVGAIVSETRSSLLQAERDWADITRSSDDWHQKKAKELNNQYWIPRKKWDGD